MTRLEFDAIREVTFPQSTGRENEKATKWGIVLDFALLGAANGVYSSAVAGDDVVRKLYPKDLANSRKNLQTMVSDLNESLRVKGYRHRIYIFYMPKQAGDHLLFLIDTPAIKLALKHKNKRGELQKALYTALQAGGPREQQLAEYIRPKNLTEEKKETYLRELDSLMRLPEGGRLQEAKTVSTTGRQLRLEVSHFESTRNWRLSLYRGKKKITEQRVRLRSECPELLGFEDFPRYLSQYSSISHERDLLANLGRWITENVFGELARHLANKSADGGALYQIFLPEPATSLLRAPLELALVGKRSLYEQGVRFSYLTTKASIVSTKVPATGALRMLAIFSLPSRTSPLDLRMERIRLEELLRTLKVTKQVNVELQFVQYGATRETLAKYLAEERGWDVVYFSGHGSKSYLLLETNEGESDPVSVPELLNLLAPTKDRLKFVFMSYCESDAVVAEESLNLLNPGQDAGQEKLSQRIGTVNKHVTSGNTLAIRLETDVLVMRYPVRDTVAISLMEELFTRLIEYGQPLRKALSQSLLKPSVLREADATSALAPTLITYSLEDTFLIPPTVHAAIEIPAPGRGGLPRPSARFVGRTIPMLEASGALAPRSPYQCVLFHGMSGVGKTSCAAELAHLHRWGRFKAFVWYRFESNDDLSVKSLFNVFRAIEDKLDRPPGTLLDGVDSPSLVRSRVLPKLRALLDDNAILLVLDDIGTLLQSNGMWLNDDWSSFFETLLSPTPNSRVVLTSQIIPSAMQDNLLVKSLPIQPLNFDESILVARMLPGLQEHFGSAAGTTVLRRALRISQGLPKLLELIASKLLEESGSDVWLTMIERKLGWCDASPGPLAEESGFGVESEEVLHVVREWSREVLRRSDDFVQTAFYFLCAIDPLERRTITINSVWQAWCEQTTTSASADPGAIDRNDISEALNRLVTSGLIEREPLANRVAMYSYGIHSTIEEVGVQDSPPGMRRAVAELCAGLFIGMMTDTGTRIEGAKAVAGCARAALRYLLRLNDYENVLKVTDQLVVHDQSKRTLGIALSAIRMAERQCGESETKLRLHSLLGRVLSLAGRNAEAESVLSSAMVNCEKAGDYRAASASAGDLYQLYVKEGVFPAAFDIARQKKALTNAANLGPITQLVDELRVGYVLALAGRNAEALVIASRVRKAIESPQDSAEVNEIAEPWQMWQLLYQTEKRALIGLEKWNEAHVIAQLELDFLRERGAPQVELARQVFGNRSIVEQLGSPRKLRDLLEFCSNAFSEHGDVIELISCYRALATWESRHGGYAAAVAYSDNALQLAIQESDPKRVSEELLMHSMVLYGGQEKKDAKLAILFAFASTALSRTHQLSNVSEAFEFLVSLEPKTGSHPLRTLIGETPGNFQGNALVELLRTIAVNRMFDTSILRPLWKEVLLAVSSRETQRRIIDRLPSSVKKALLEPGGVDAYHEALSALPEKKARLVHQKLVAAGIVKEVDIKERIAVVRPLIVAFAEYLKGNCSAKTSAVDLLLSKNLISTTTWQRLVSGERNYEELSESLDETQQAVLRELLRLVGMPSRQEVLDGLPESVREAIQQEKDGKIGALSASLDRFPSDEADEIVAKLVDVGIIRRLSNQDLGG